MTEAREVGPRVVQDLGFEPQAPVPASDFADPAKRAEWTREKSMQVFSMLDPNDPMRAVDLFVENPLDFEELWSRSKLVDLEATSVRVASVADLIELKRIAGRPQDLVDIEQLEEIARRERDAE